MQTRPSVLKHRPQIGEGLTSLRVECRARRLARHRIDARLTRGKDEIPYSHRLRVGTNARNTAAVDDFLWKCHRRSPKTSL